MKTKLWMLGAAVAALTSCTQSEVVEIPENRVIGFDTYVGKDARAVTTINTDGLTNFWVYCAKGEETGTSFDEDDEDNNTEGTQHFFDAVEVTKAGTNYSYAHKYWQGDKYYRFASYSNGNSELNSGVTFNVGNDGNWGFTFTEYEVGEKDLIVALPQEVSVNAEVTDVTHVNLAFYHMLARVQVIFYIEELATGQKLQIDPFTIPAVTKGTCTVTTDGTSVEPTIAWTPIIVQDAAYEFNGDETNNSTIVESGTEKVLFECYAIPQANGSLKIPEIEIHTLNANGDVLHTAHYTEVSLALTDPSHASWKPGNIYSYQAQIGGDAHQIHFKATVDNWDDPTEGDKNIGSPSTTVDNNNP